MTNPDHHAPSHANHLRVSVLKLCDAEGCTRRIRYRMFEVLGEMSNGRTCQWLNTFVSRCQRIIRRAADTEPRELLGEIERWMAELPRELDVADQCLLRTVIGQALSRIIQIHGVNHNPLFAAALLTFTSADFTPEHWQLPLTRLLECCGTALTRRLDGEVDHSVSNVQVRRALSLIEAHFSDEGFSLDALSVELGLSPSYLSRLLKRVTGRGFLSLLHHRRVMCADRLLSESALSVKEIAGAVGYRSTTQLDRHFKRLRGSTPISIRARSAAADTRTDDSGQQTTLPSQEL